MRLFFIALITMSMQVTAADDVRTEYYGNFPFWESPVQVFKGQTPLTAQQAENRMHIKVEYDEFDRLVSVQMRLGNQLKEPAPFFQGLYFHSEDTRITHQENKETHRYFNRFGAQITGWGEVWEKVYTLDEYGRYTRMDFLGKGGEPVENSWGTQYYTWDHQFDGSVIEERFSASGELMPHRRGFEFKRIRLTFSPDGHLALMQNIDENGSLVPAPSGASQYRYFYDSRGMFLRWEVYDAAGQPALGPTGTAGEFYINSNAGYHQIAFFDKTGERSLHASGAAYWRSAYDQFGNHTELSLFGIDGEPTRGQLGFHKHRFIYDETGLHLIGREYFGTDDKPVAIIDDFHRAVYVRDEQGLLTELRFLDLDGNLVMNNYEKVAFYRYSYDENGVRTATQKFDASGNALPNSEAGS